MDTSSLTVFFLFFFLDSIASPTYENCVNTPRTPLIGGRRTLAVPDTLKFGTLLVF